jgi:hypothetical protein
MKPLVTAAFVLALWTTSIQISAQDVDSGTIQEPGRQEEPGETDLSPSREARADRATVHDGKQGSFWMEQKMRFSTDILAGLAESDFDKIGKSATLMQGLSRVEKFVRRGPQGYKDELKLFNMANRAMIKAADEENLEAATLAFHRLTVSCVSCHQNLRGQEEK